MLFEIGCAAHAAGMPGTSSPRRAGATKRAAWIVSSSISRVDASRVRGVEAHALGAFERAMHKRVVYMQPRGKLSEGPGLLLTGESAS